MSKNTIGLLLALITYILWGLLSLYWKLFSGISSYSIFSYRIVFTVLTMLIYMIVSKQSKVYSTSLKQLVNHKPSLIKMILASFMVSINWLVYIFAVSHGLATQASLGYYILPIVSVVLALIFLHEKINGLSKLAIILATGGVGILVLQTGKIPWISLILAFSFAFYGLIKKKVNLSSDIAMLVESLMIAPFALSYLILMSKDHFFQHSFIQIILLMLSGVITAIPLLLFAEALKRAELNQVGFVQYINPTIQLAIAVFIFGESMTVRSLSGFILIWLAIIIFVLGQFMVRKK